MIDNIIFLIIKYKANKKYINMMSLLWLFLIFTFFLISLKFIIELIVYFLNKFFWFCFGMTRQLTASAYFLRGIWYLLTNQKIKAFVFGKKCTHINWRIVTTIFYKFFTIFHWIYFLFLYIKNAITLRLIILIFHLAV